MSLGLLDQGMWVQAAEHGTGSELREPEGCLVSCMAEDAPAAHGAAALQGQSSCLELDGSPEGMNEGDFTEGVEFMHHFQVADHSRLIRNSKVITSLW